MWGALGIIVSWIMILSVLGYCYYYAKYKL